MSKNYGQKKPSEVRIGIVLISEAKVEYYVGGAIGA